MQVGNLAMDECGGLRPLDAGGLREHLVSEDLCIGTQTTTAHEICANMQIDEPARPVEAVVRDCVRLLYPFMHVSIEMLGPLSAFFLRKSIPPLLECHHVGNRSSGQNTVSNQFEAIATICCSMHSQMLLSAPVQS